jgi:hypothetical protein
MCDSGIAGPEEDWYSRTGRKSTKKPIFHVYRTRSVFFSGRGEPSQDLSYKRAF